MVIGIDIMRIGTIVGIGMTLGIDIQVDPAGDRVPGTPDVIPAVRWGILPGTVQTIRGVSTIDLPNHMMVGVGPGPEPHQGEDQGGLILLKEDIDRAPVLSRLGVEEDNHQDQYLVLPSGKVGATDLQVAIELEQRYFF